jgi:hypothetical protein
MTDRAEVLDHLGAFDAADHVNALERRVGYELPTETEEALFVAFHIATRAGWKPTTDELWEEVTDQAAPKEKP